MSGDRKGSSFELIFTLVFGSITTDGVTIITAPVALTQFVVFEIYTFVLFYLPPPPLAYEGMWVDSSSG